MYTASRTASAASARIPGNPAVRHDCVDKHVFFIRDVHTAEPVIIIGIAPEFEPVSSYDHRKYTDPGNECSQHGNHCDIISRFLQNPFCNCDILCYNQNIYGIQ